MLESLSGARKVSEASVPDWWNVIWPASQEVPDAWHLQRLDSDGGDVPATPRTKCPEINSLLHRDFELALQGGLAAYHSQRTALVESLLLYMPWS